MNLCSVRRCMLISSVARQNSHPIRLASFVQRGGARSQAQPTPGLTPRGQPCGEREAGHKKAPSGLLADGALEGSTARLEGLAKRRAAWKILAPDWSGRLPVTRRNGGNVQSSWAGSARKK